MRDRKLILLFAVLIACVLEGCTKSPEPIATYCVLLDMSGVRESSKTKQQYSENISTLINEIKPGDALIVQMITGSSINEAEFVVNHKFSSFTPSTDNKMIKDAEQTAFNEQFTNEKENILTEVQSFILNDPRIANSTDIISAIHVAANVFKKYISEDKYLVIFSDMEQYSSDYKFPTENLNENRIDQIIQVEIGKARGIPDLSGVKVYVVGAKSKNSDNFFRIKNFWLSYFNACNATLMKEDYGAAMIILN